MVLLSLTFATKTECDPMAIAVRAWWKFKGKERSHQVVAVMSQQAWKS